MRPETPFMNSNKQHISCIIARVPGKANICDPTNIYIVYSNSNPTNMCAQTWSTGNYM